MNIKTSIFTMLLILLVGVLVVSCAAPQYGSYPPGSGDQPQSRSQAQKQAQPQSMPQRGGYEEQMKQEQTEQSRKAAGELLPALMELQNQMIKNQNKQELINVYLLLFYDRKAILQIGGFCVGTFQELTLSNGMNVTVKYINYNKNEIIVIYKLVISSKREADS